MLDSEIDKARIVYDLNPFDHPVLGESSGFDIGTQRIKLDTLGGFHLLFRCGSFNRSIYPVLVQQDGAPIQSMLQTTVEGTLLKR